MVKQDTQRMYYINDNLISLDRIFDQNFREGYLRLDLNENPGGLPEEFVRETLEEITPQFLSQYPETLPFTQTLADYLGCGMENLCLVNGSAEGIRHVIEAYSSPGGKVLGVDPTYAMYSVYSGMYGREFVPIDYDDDLSMPIERILSAMTEDIQILFICNPNNPVGNVYSFEEMDMIVKKAREMEITILIDEAYHYFYPVTFIEYALNNDNVFLTRSFSKLFSLAGARLGFVVGRSEGIAIVQKLCTPHNVNAFSMKFAEKIIKTDGMIDELIRKQLDGKNHLIDRLKKEGYKVSGKEGNFVFIETRTEPAKVMKRLKEEEKILVKTYKGVETMGEVIRVTTGERELMDVFVDALLKLDRR